MLYLKELTSCCLALLRLSEESAKNMPKGMQIKTICLSHCFEERYEATIFVSEKLLLSH